MSEENKQKLKMLRDDLEALKKFHEDILTKEPTIARPFHQAHDEANRRYKHVTEGTVPKK